MRALRRSQSIDIVKALRSRKTIRGYKPDLVPKEVLKEILEIASRSPSAKKCSTLGDDCNCWESAGTDQAR